jgi:hypothetical protein
VRSSGKKPKHGSPHPGRAGEGKIGRANKREPLVDASLPRTPEGGCRTGVQGLAGEDRQAAAVQIFVGRVNTAGPGVEGAPTPIAARACGTWNPVRVRLRLWRGR